jgi:glycosidase
MLEEVLKGFVSPRALRDRYEWAKQSYTYTDVSDNFVTFLDNHDQMARPYRRFLYMVPDKRQVLLGVAYLFTAPGIPTIYYGTEQGFDGGGNPGPYQDAHIRECMFGGTWGAFGTEGMHFFNIKNPLYKEMAKLASVRRSEPILKYGRFYFREISEDGKNFSYPERGYGMLTYSRILDNREVLVVLNLRASEYTNHVVVDKGMTPPGTVLVDLLNKRKSCLVDERSGRATVTLTLPPYGIAILKKKESVHEKETRNS